MDSSTDVLPPPPRSTNTTAIAENIDNDEQDILIVNGIGKALTKDNSYTYSYVHIKNATLGIGKKEKGILDLCSLTDILIENGKIMIGGTGNSFRYFHQRHMDETETEDNKKKHPLYGAYDEIDKLYVGTDGRSGDSCSGGLGGGGLKLKCNQLILKNSVINVSGCPCCNGGMWGCESGSNGSCLIICNDLSMDNKSEINATMYNQRAGRIVIQINNNINCLVKRKRECLVYGYIKSNIDTEKKVFPIELVALCVDYCSSNEYKDYKISPKPIFVDKEWNKIDAVKTNNQFVSDFKKQYGLY